MFSTKLYRKLKINENIFNYGSTSIYNKSHQKDDLVEHIYEKT